MEKENALTFIWPQHQALKYNQVLKLTRRKPLQDAIREEGEEYVDLVLKTSVSNMKMGIEQKNDASYAEEQVYSGRASGIIKWVCTRRTGAPIYLPSHKAS